ncbi:MAG: hypothetical protein K0U74_12715 [Alphaproteobacteria bacterium]|nr:hypothetical protein [Alphaproteobacteria bacterium]
MILDIFKGNSRKKAKPPPLPGEDETGLAADGADVSKTELRLERELAVLLARNPKHSPPKQAAPDDYDIDEPLHLSETAKTEVVGITPAPHAHGAETRASPLPDESTPPTTATRNRGLGPRPETPWIKSAGRSHRASFVRKAASVAITLLVTGFIISIVAVILFGMPSGFNPPKAFADRTATLTPASAKPHGPATMKAPTTARTPRQPPPPRLQWVTHSSQ